MSVRFTDNLSYKFVALGVAMILWLSMLSRRDSIMAKDFELNLKLPPHTELASPVPQIIRVEVAGPRVALKKINQLNPDFNVDLSGAKIGRQVVQLSRSGLNLPIGARVLSIDPQEFSVEIREQTPAGEKN